MTSEAPPHRRTFYSYLLDLPAAHQFWLLFGIAFLIRAAGAIATRQYQNLERYELERVALSLASTGVFGNPYNIPTGPSAHVSPAYPLVLAGIFKLFGVGVRGEVVKEALACAVTALQCALLPVLAVKLRFSPRTGFVAGLLAALLPLKLITESQGDWESNWAALAVMGAVFLTASTWRQSAFSQRNAVWFGLGWGACLLITWTIAPFYVAVVLVGAFLTLRHSFKQYLLFTATATVCLLLSISPWVLRNWFAFHAFVPGRTNAGIELHISNNDDAVAREQTNFLRGLYSKYHPLQSESEARKVLVLGEVEYNRGLTRETRTWIFSHPARFLSLTLSRFGLFWFYPDSKQLIKSMVLWVRTALALIGLVMLWRVNAISAGVLSLALFVLPLPNYLVHVGLKHSYPIDWILTLLAAFAITTVVTATARRA